MSGKTLKTIADLLTSLSLIGSLFAAWWFSRKANDFKNRLLNSERERDNLKIEKEIMDADLDDLIDTANNRAKRRDS